MRRSYTLEPLETSEIAEVCELARAIWRHHYATILSSAQIEYMLRQKYTQADLARYPGATDQWLDVLRVEGVLSGFLRTSLAHGEGFRLEEIYLAQAVRGEGFGRLLLERAESLALEHGRKRVFLRVNRANTDSIATYQRNGYVITRSEVFDIGHGFVMDDHLMEKSIAG
jgi:GNAT superfamily N-acetyltransferase